MFAAFALLADADLHNVMRKLALDIHRAHDTGLTAGLLPPHISLKQPFRIADLASIEQFFARFAASIPPFDLTLTQVSGPPIQEQQGDRGVVWIDVQETPELRVLHERLNAELAQQFRGTEALFDGSDYHFHATIAFVEGAERYRHVMDDVRGQPIDITYRPQQLAMFYYDDDAFGSGSFITYKILPLGKQNPA